MLSSQLWCTESKVIEMLIRMTGLKPSPPMPQTTTKSISAATPFTQFKSLAGTITNYLHFLFNVFQVIRYIELLLHWSGLCVGVGDKSALNRPKNVGYFCSTIYDLGVQKIPVSVLWQSPLSNCSLNETGHRELCSNNNGVRKNHCSGRL